MKRLMLSLLAIGMLTFSTGCCSHWWPWTHHGYYGVDEAYIPNNLLPGPSVEVLRIRVHCDRSRATGPTTDGYLSTTEYGAAGGAQNEAAF